MSDINDTNILLEDINGKFDFIAEAVGQIQDQVKVLPTIQKDIEEIKTEVKAIRATVTNHEKRLVSANL
jgi:hypothetical protein